MSAARTPIATPIATSAMTSMVAIFPEIRYPEKANARRSKESSTRVLDGSRGDDLLSCRVIYGIPPFSARPDARSSLSVSGSAERPRGRLTGKPGILQIAGSGVPIPSGGLDDTSRIGEGRSGQSQKPDREAPKKASRRTPYGVRLTRAKGNEYAVVIHGRPGAKDTPLCPYRQAERA